jgi:hypothetical protein
VIVGSIFKLIPGCGEGARVTEQRQIDLRQAVDIATKTTRELYSEALLEDLLLEEVYY